MQRQFVPKRNTRRNNREILQYNTFLVFFKSWKGDESWNAAIYCNVLTDVTSVFFGIKRLSHIFYTFLYINNNNSQQCFPKMVAYSSLSYIFCIFSKERHLSVRIRQTGYGRFFSNLGLNVWRNQPEIANHSNTVVKARQFSTECTNALIANVYIASEKIVIFYLMSVRPSF